MPLAKVLCGNILNYGYCVHPETFKYAAHPEYGDCRQMD